MGQHLKAESTSSVAASVLGGASMTIVLTSLNVPQSQRKSFILIWLLTEEWEGSFLGKDRSWTILRSVESWDFGTVPSGEVRKGPMRNSSLEHENGPE